MRKSDPFTAISLRPTSLRPLIHWESGDFRLRSVMRSSNKSFKIICFVYYQLYSIIQFMILSPMCCFSQRMMVGKNCSRWRGGRTCPYSLRKARYENLCGQTPSITPEFSKRLPVSPRRKRSDSFGDEETFRDDKARLYKIKAALWRALSHTRPSRRLL